MYSQEITRRHRAAFVIAIDQSTSMQEMVRFGKLVISKAEAVAYTTNTLLTELMDRCRRTDGLRNYYDVAVLGYGNDKVMPLLDSEGFMSIEQLAFSLSKIEAEPFDQESFTLQHKWIKPHAEGNTPMYEALLKVRNMLHEWCSLEHNHESFPPVVINITDGEASDCDDAELHDICEQIRRTATADGNTLLLNIHISTDCRVPSIIFPMAEELTSAGHYAHLLAGCSSIMPAAFNSAIAELKGAGATPPYYGMGYNATVVELLSIINIGSRSITNMG